MIRLGNRKDKDLRKIKVTPNFMKFAEGSCLFETGNTKVICTASVEDGVPKFLRNKNSGWITAEYGMLPRSCTSRIARESSRGKVGGRTQEIQRLIGRSLRSVVNLKLLGERTIWMDADVVQGDGGTRCASITGCFIALVLALKKLQKEGVLKKMPLVDYVAAVSVGIVDKRELLDLDYSEDSTANVDMNIVMTKAGKLIEVQGTAEGEPFSIGEMNRLVRIAKTGMNKIFAIQEKILKI
ncbi:MAG: ribonuclease PH [Candidatus Omnitrophota bacterium]